MKTLLHLCVVSVGRTNSDLGRAYKRKRKEGKHKMNALNALNKIRFTNTINAHQHIYTFYLGVSFGFL